MKKLKMILAIASLLIAATPAARRRQVQTRGKQPIYTITINVVDRTTKAINYQHRNGSTTIDFQGHSIDAGSTRRSQSRKQTGIHGSRSRIRRPAIGNAIRS